jgi:hypothetical protein
VPFFGVCVLSSAASGRRTGTGVERDQQNKKSEDCLATVVLHHKIASHSHFKDATRKKKKVSFTAHRPPTTKKEK